MTFEPGNDSSEGLIERVLSRNLVDIEDFLPEITADDKVRTVADLSDFDSVRLPCWVSR